MPQFRNVSRWNGIQGLGRFGLGRRLSLSRRKLDHRSWVEARREEKRFLSRLRLWGGIVRPMSQSSIDSMEVNECLLEVLGKNLVGVGSLQQGFPAMEVTAIE